MSFNVRYGTARDGKNSWKHRRPFVIELLKKQQADVIGTQEALRFQLDEIRGELDHYGEIGVGRDDGLHSGEYNAILYRTDRFRVGESGTFWFSETPAHAGSRSWGNRLPRICSWALLIEKNSGKGFYIYNVHLDTWSQESRRKSIDLLLRKVRNRHHDYPLLITGDFNINERNPIIRFLKGGSDENGELSPVKLIDTYRAVHPKAAGGTFNLFWGYRYGPKIDYIFAEATTDVLSTEIIRDSFNGRYPSDHFPITAKVLLEQKTVYRD